MDVLSTSPITQKRPSRFPYYAPASLVLQAAHDRLSVAYGRLCMAVARVEACIAQELAQEAAIAQAATVGAGEGMEMRRSALTLSAFSSF